MFPAIIQIFGLNLEPIEPGTWSMKQPCLMVDSVAATYTIPMMKTTLDALQAAGVTSRIKIMVGGAIVTQAYADRIGADGYASDAVSAVAKTKELLVLG